MKYTGKDLLELGAPQGKQIGQLLRQVNATPHTREEVIALVEAVKPPPARPLMSEPAPCQWNLSPENDDEWANEQSVKATMAEVLRTPCVIEGAVMPDACPAGPVGTIPVGGVVATDAAIIPGMHSADICCSLMATVFNDAEPKAVLDKAQSITHFGPGGREVGKQFALPDTLKERMRQLPMGVQQLSAAHLGTQGDGNHFLYVGVLESTGQTVMVTHHGSRGPGARLYTHGKKIAEKFRQVLSPETLKQNAWIPFDTPEGQQYWSDLQVIREWTKRNHECLHEAVAMTEGTVDTRFWNEHNFVFRDEKTNVFWHAKGATPINDEWLPDTNGTQIIPLNMAEPILFVKGTPNEQNLGFAPHGAGRNVSRTKHKKRLLGETDEAVFARETQHIDARFYSGNIDVSELPSAYKNAESVQNDMERFGLADVVDRVLPYGCIMAGDWQQDAPWRNKKKRR